MFIFYTPVLARALTLYVEVHRATDLTAHAVWHAAPERSPVVARHLEDGEGGASVGDANSAADCDHWAAVQPEEGEGGAGGGAGQAHGSSWL